MSLLEVRNLKTWFATKRGEVRAVDDVSFAVEAGEVVSLITEARVYRQDLKAAFAIIAHI